jgi:hypothetical protein
VAGAPASCFLPPALLPPLLPLLLLPLLPPPLLQLLLPLPLLLLLLRAKAQRAVVAQGADLIHISFDLHPHLIWFAFDLI